MKIGRYLTPGGVTHRMLHQTGTLGFKYVALTAIQETIINLVGMLFGLQLNEEDQQQLRVLFEKRLSDAQAQRLVLHIASEVLAPAVQPTAAANVQAGTQKEDLPDHGVRWATRHKINWNTTGFVLLFVLGIAVIGLGGVGTLWNMDPTLRTVLAFLGAFVAFVAAVMLFYDAKWGS